jgi:hypothetical protein
MEDRDHEYVLSAPRAIAFFRAIRDDDCFTILWELAERSPKPVPFESIRRTFGAEPRYLLQVLSRLQHLGVAAKEGRQWTVCKWAKSSLEYLEDIMKNVTIEIAQPSTSSPEVYALPEDVGTRNGFWRGSTSPSTALSQSSNGDTSASAKDALDFSSLELTDNPKNETPSHDYK